jgi:hypothetical protein
MNGWSRSIRGAVGTLGALLVACSSGGGGNAPTATSQLVCRTTYEGCRCSMASTSNPTPFECSSTALDGTLCCASSGYPSSGYCECTKPTNAVQCWSYQTAGSPNRSCVCSKTPPATDAHTTDIRPATSCSPSGSTFCCSDSSDCYCYGGTGACWATQTQVSSCSAKAGTCPSYETEVASCSGSGGSGGGGSGSCDLKPENWYSDCSKGCGDVMTCQSYCSGCAPRCYVACETTADCERSGAGSCEISAKGTSRCSKAPTKCP